MAAELAAFREYNPALASVMVAAQAGSSIAARVGTMQGRGQINALAVMSIDPIRYVVLRGAASPRRTIGRCARPAAR